MNPPVQLDGIRSKLARTKTRVSAGKADRQHVAVAGTATGMARLLEAVLVRPDHGAYLPCSGAAEPDPTKVVPPVPKSLFNQGQ